MSDWRLVYDGFDPEEEGLREALCTLANGYFATRGAAPESSADDVHYPGTYAAGVFNRLTTEVDGREVFNESIVNLPNWLPLAVRGPDGWFDDRDARVVSHHVELDPRRALLTRRTTFEDPDGRRLTLAQRRFVSMRDPHLAALETTIVAENWDGPVVVRSAIDGGVRNSGVARYRRPRRRPPAGRRRAAGLRRGDRAGGRDHPVAHPRRRGDPHPARAAASGLPSSRPTVEVGDDAVAQEFHLDARRRASRSPSRRWSPCSTRATPPSASRPSRRASGRRRSPGTSRSSTRATRSAGTRSGAPATSRSASTTRSPARSTCTSSTCSRPCRTTPSASTSGVPARGLHGEAYRGHIFWDELFVFPFLSTRFPQVTRSLLLYRYRRLDAARRAAADAGLRRRHVPVAEREQRPGGDPAAAPQPRVGAVAPRRLAPAAPRQRRGRAERVAVLPGHRRPRVPPLPRRRDAPRDRPVLGQRRRPTTGRSTATRSSGSSGPTSTTTATRTAAGPASTTTPTRTSWRCGACAGASTC